MRSNGETLFLSYCLLLGQHFAGKRGNGQKNIELILLLWEKE